MKSLMKNRGVLVCTLLLAVVSAGSAWAQEADRTSAAEDQIAKYKILVDRNIFDPARRPEAPQREERPKPEPRVDRLYLTGVLVSAKDQLAFFEGSRDEYFGAIERGGKIAGFSVANVDSDRAILIREDRKLSLLVGTGLTRREGEDWQQGSGMEYSNGSSSSGSLSKGSKEYSYRDKGYGDKKDSYSKGFKKSGWSMDKFIKDNTKRDGSDSAKLELLKKLKERRMQELKK